MLKQPEYLPMSRNEMNALGWDELDVLLVSGDAYVDSHAFAMPLLGRWLVAHGYRTGLVCQPNWEDINDIVKMGRPRLFAGISAGSLDSLVAHYTAFRKKRHDDAYTPGGKEGARPNRATLVYTGLVRRAFPGLPVAIGGIEASMRRATHYDFWSDSLRKSILPDSKADILLYGMAEKSIVEFADLFAKSADARSIPAAAIAQAQIKGSAYMVHPDNAPEGVELPSHEAIVADAELLVKTAVAFEKQMLQRGPRLMQRTSGRAVVFEPPQDPLDAETMDRIYGLPFTRKAHPSYTEPIPAVEMLSGSVNSHRGCAGGCSFCSLAMHQGRVIQSRSAASIKAEVEAMTKSDDWPGSISDIGGPSANMWNAYCAGDQSACERQSCLVPKRCRHFKAPQEEQIAMLREVAAIPGVNHVRIASGVRHDLALESEEYLSALAKEFTGGQLKIAPEHIIEKVLKYMRKTGKRGLETFLKKFAVLSEEAGKEQYVIPYLMSAFPGCTDEDMQELSKWLERRGFRPKQVQCFIPTPGTVATAMFYAKVDLDGRPIFVARTDGERLFQHRILLPDAEPKPGQHFSAAPARQPRRDSRDFDKPKRPSFDREDRPRRPRLDGERPERPSGGGYNRGDKRDFGKKDFSDRPRRPRPDGDRRERPGSGGYNRDDKRDFGKKDFSDRPRRPRPDDDRRERSGGGYNRDDKRGFGNKDFSDRPRRPRADGFKPRPDGERRERPAGGDFKREGGNRDFPKKSFSSRPPRRDAKPGERPFNKGPRKPGGFGGGKPGRPGGFGKGGPRDRRDGGKGGRP